MKSFYEMIKILNESRDELKGYDAWLTQPPYRGERWNPDSVEWEEDWIDGSKLVRIVGGKFVDDKGRHLPWLDGYAEQASSSGEVEMWLTFEYRTGGVWHNDGKYPGPDGDNFIDVAVDIRNPMLQGRKSNLRISLDRVNGSIASHFFGELEHSPS